MSRKSVLVGVGALVFLGVVSFLGYWFLNKTKVEKKTPEQEKTITTSSSAPSFPDFLVSFTQSDNPLFKDCPDVRQEATKYEGNIIYEYVIPISCTEKLVFERYVDPNDSQPLDDSGGFFRVTYEDNTRKTFLFDHQGLLYDIAGLSPWTIKKIDDDVIVIDLMFVDLGVAEWKYYISKKEKRLVVGYKDYPRSILVDTSKKYVFSFDSVPENCENKEQLQVTQAFVFNDKKYYLDKEVSVSCQDMGDLGGVDIPWIGVKNVDLKNHRLVLNVWDKKEIVFDYVAGKIIGEEKMKVVPLTYEYKNDQYGFKFSYPQSVELEMSDNQGAEEEILFGKKKNIPSFAIFYFSLRYTTSSLDQIYKDFKKDSLDIYRETDTYVVNVNGISAYRVHQESPELPSLYYIIPYSEGYFIFSGTDVENYEYQEEIFKSFQYFK